MLVAKSGRQALSIVHEQSVDLILLDVVMPELDGFSVMKQLKSNVNSQNIPVIFITGLESSKDETYGFELGAVDYIHKPFNSSVVLARVSSQLKIIQQRNDLQQLSEELKQASEAKGMFLANMSHEIRTPLTTIIGYAESMLSQNIPKNEWTDAVNIIDNSGKHLLSLVNNILDFSKIEAGELSIELIDVELDSLLQQVHVICEQQAHKKHLNIHWRFNGKIPRRIKTDPTRLKQILINLISNGIKFTEQGSVTIVVSALNEQLHFEIKDTGIGIPNDKLSSLFNSFTQVDNSTSRKYGGTGLGLSISCRLAKELGGQIAVESQVNEGSTFSVFIDLINQAPGETFDQLNSDTNHQASQQTQQVFKGKVLIAEDHPENRQLFSLNLSALGFEVNAVDNGEKAVQACISDDYQLVLLDIQMPVMNGIEAQQLIRSCGLDMPIIALTANVMKDEIDSYLAAGFTDHLAKPLDQEQLLTKLNKYCDNDVSTQQDVAIPQHLLDELRQKFKQSFAQYTIELQTAVKQRDTKTLASLAHKFQGAAKSFGFTEEAKVAELLERYIQDSNNNISQTSQQLINLLNNE